MFRRVKSSAKWKMWFKKAGFEFKLNKSDPFLRIFLLIQTDYIIFWPLCHMRYSVAQQPHQTSDWTPVQASPNASEYPGLGPQCNSKDGGKKNKTNKNLQFEKKAILCVFKRPTLKYVASLEDGWSPLEGRSPLSILMEFIAALRGKVSKR